MATYFGLSAIVFIAVAAITRTLSAIWPHASRASIMAIGTALPLVVFTVWWLVRIVSGGYSLFDPMYFAIVIAAFPILLLSALAAHLGARQP
jgi:steroid 5-alpha reductase family enzyme